jgi:OOP family OmpA-OmpF porin
MLIREHSSSDFQSTPLPGRWELFMQFSIPHSSVPSVCVSRGIAAAALSALCLLSAPVAFAQDLSNPTVLHEGPVYSTVRAVSKDQAQVVMLRKAGPSDGEGAHVYVDGEFHTALLQHGYTRICLREGSHSLEAYVGDAPAYAGKERPKTRVNLEGGKTYFVAVSDDGIGEVVPLRRADAERLLGGAREQRHVISRASTVIPCQFESSGVESLARYTLNADVLFEFGRSDAQALTAKGRSDLARIAAEIKTKSAAGGARVVVRGHADPIGSTASNQLLSEWRARTVRRALVEEGLKPDQIVIEGVGSNEPVVSCPVGGSKQARVACNAPNRRVEVKAEQQG